MIEQRTLDWHRQRLGRFNGSEIHKLMVTSRKKGEIFGDTAKSYIEQVAGESLLDRNMVTNDIRFAAYLERNNPSTKAMEWGSLTEEEAKIRYTLETGLAITDCPSIDGRCGFRASPDGMVVKTIGGVERKVGIEVKCPCVKNFVKFVTALTNESQEANNEGLRNVAPEYFAQVQAQMACADFDSVDFVVYSVDMNRIHIATIARDDEFIATLAERTAIALEMVGEIRKKFGEKPQWEGWL